MDTPSKTIHPTAPTAEKKKRNYTPPPPLPPPPLGLAVLTRDEAAAFFGVSLNTWTTWEHEGRVTIPRYRAASGTGRPIYYAPDDLTRLREEFRRSEEPHEDPDRPGVYRVPIRSRLHTLHALIDAQDLPKVRGKNWNWSPGRKVANAERTGEVLLATMGTQTPLKRIILGLEHAGKDTNIVYANGDPLDCRRGNLVVRSNSEKNVARGKSAPRSACSSKYKGVHFDPKRCRWVAQIASAGKHAFLGRFEDEVEAALAYDTAARGLLGPHAYLNFPDPNAAPPRTGNDPRGNPVRDKQKYTVTPPLPPPPEGVAVADRERAAELMGVSADTFHHWVNAGRITIPRYRVKAVTGTPILYAVVDLERLRDQFAKEGQPFPDPQDANTWRVPIWTKRGFIEALVDAQDQPIVQGRTWNYTKRKGMGDETGVVILVGERGIEREILKRLIMSVRDAGVGVSVVHANGNPLDCRRGNLVVRTQAQKVRRAFKNTHRCGEPCTSIYKGVCWLERYGKWQAQIRVDDKPRNLGLFDDELDAACAYDEAAREVWGEEARVNFPEKGELPTAMRGPAKNEPAGKLAA